MRSTRVSVIQLSTGADVAANLAATGALLADAAADGAQLAVLPENFAAMGADEAFRVTIAEPDGSGPVQDFLAATAARLGIWIVGGTLPIHSADPARPYAACVVMDGDGNRRGRYDKLHLFDVNVPGSDESYRESAHTMPGDSPLRIDTPWGGLAIGVCYDLRFPELFRCVADGEVNLMAIPAAFTVTTGAAHWDVLLRARAIENQCFVAAAAQTGLHPGGRRTFGHSMIVGPWGDVLLDLDDAVGYGCADVDADELRTLRERFPVRRHRRNL